MLVVVILAVAAVSCQVELSQDVSRVESQEGVDFLLKAIR